MLIHYSPMPAPVIRYDRKFDQWIVEFNSFSSEKEARDWAATLRSIPEPTQWQKHTYYDEPKKSMKDYESPVYWDRNIGLFVWDEDEAGKKIPVRVNL